MKALSKYSTFETKVLTVPEFFTDECKDWALSKEEARFQHANDCQFIFWVGDLDEYPDTFKDAGFSDLFCQVMSEARAKGFEYVRLTD